MHTPLEQVRVGFVGCGRISDLQVLGYLDHPHAEVFAVCDRDAALATRRAGEWRARKIYTDVVDLLRDPDVNAVEIALPHHLHREVAVAALQAAKHVSLQKPPTLTIAELDDVAEAAKTAARTVRVLENFMYYPPHVKAKELVDEGLIGAPLSVRIKTAAGRLDDGWHVPASAQQWRMNPELCGGGPTCFDHGYHCYNMGRFFIPEPVERVHAWIHVSRFGDTALYDGPALIGWKYAGVPKFGSWEVIASLGMRVRSKYYASDDRMEIHGTEGIIWINRCTGFLLDEPSLVLYRDGETRAWHDIPTDWAESFRLAAHDFIDALLEGRQPAQDLADARETLRFAIATNLAARAGREVCLDEVGPETRALLPAPAQPR
ncbi:MAG TPA: Gfo/Idh/MocA family oxidoreductase [Candidatus Kryptonia bacterium]|nr:Gfo/Idh/MocA family oxidoreductase [Candidatus Kryptonia bacterium]